MHFGLRMSLASLIFETVERVGVPNRGTEKTRIS